MESFSKPKIAIYRFSRSIKSSVIMIKDNVRDGLHEEYEKNSISTIFIIGMSALLAIFIVCAILTGAETVYNILFYDRIDTFMDYFNSIMHTFDRPYTGHGVIYPPLAVSFYTFIGHFLYPYVDSTLVGREMAFALRSSQLGIMSYVIIMLFTFYLLHFIFKKLMNNTNLRGEILFLLIVFSFPFIYGIERGNSIILALVFCLVFLAGYRSENNTIRYISYVALGCAAGFKLYPMMLVLLILRERRYKEMLICLVIVAALVFVPFVFTDGTPLVMLNAIISFTEVPWSSTGYTNLSQMVFALGQWFDVPENHIGIISRIVIILFTLVSLIIIIFAKNMKFWKVLALISCNLILVSAAGTGYLMVYLVLPIIFFLKSEKKMTKNNFFYMVLFILALSLMPGFEIGSIPPGALIITIKALFLLTVAIVLISEGIIEIYNGRFKHVDKGMTNI